MTGATHARISGVSTATLAQRIEAMDWQRLATDLDAHGYAVVSTVLTPQACAELARMYASEAMFRSRIVMARHSFGRGEYQYFAYPLPEMVATLRQLLYRRLAGIANRWNEALGIDVRFPDDHAAFLKRCHSDASVARSPSRHST